jgi:hypothetical protein
VEQNRLLIIILQESHTWINSGKIIFLLNHTIEFFLKKKLNVNPINTMIQKTSKNYKYNLINVTNILHKLVEALAALRLTLTLLA